MKTFSLKEIHFQIHLYSPLGDRLFFQDRHGRQRLALTTLEQQEKALFESHNEKNHCGITKTLNSLETAYYWKTMVKDVKNWVNVSQCNYFMKFDVRLHYTTVGLEILSDVNVFIEAFHDYFRILIVSPGGILNSALSCHCHLTHFFVYAITKK